jgi:hypothetical protein
MSEMVELVAKAMAERDRGVGSWDRMFEPSKQMFRSFARAAIEATRVPLLALFADHYWDTFQGDRFLIMKHVESILGPILDESLK